MTLSSSDGSWVSLGLGSPSGLRLKPCSPLLTSPQEPHHVPAAQEAPTAPLQGVSAWSLWLGVKGDMNPRTGIRCRVRHSSSTFPSTRGDGWESTGRSREAPEAGGRAGNRIYVCATPLFAWQSLGFLDHCTFASTCLGLLLSSIDKQGHKWSDKSAAGAGRQAQNLDWTEAQLTQLCPAALTLCPGSLSSLRPLVLVLILGCNTHSGFREAPVKDAPLCPQSAHVRPAHSCLLLATSKSGSTLVISLGCLC